MKIGIYGDSFALGYETEDWNWYVALAKMLDASYTTYGYPATSTFYSFKIFKKEYKKYDLNIFLVTHWQRYTKEVRIETNKSKHWVAGMSFIDHIRKTVDNLFESDSDLLNKLESWFVLSDDDFLKTSQDLMISEISRLCPNVIIIPCFNNDNSISFSKKQELGLKETGSCEHFVKKQLEWFGIKDVSKVKERPGRFGSHFTDETNKLFANNVFDLIKYGKPIECPAVIPHKFDINYYFADVEGTK